MGRGTRLLPVLLVGVGLLAGCRDANEPSASGEPTTDASTATTIPATGDFDGLVEVAGHDVHVKCYGSGEPTIMVELGAGPTLSSWSTTMQALADGVRVCGYERAGTGRSEPGDEPRTSQVIADELSELLANARISTPIVLVSHSLGGQHAQAFAQRHPDEVAGLVFLDPRTAEFQLGYRDTLTPAELEEDQQQVEEIIEREPFGPEIAAEDEGAEAIVAAGDLPDVPVRVLTSDGPHDLWVVTHEHLAAQVTDGEQRVVRGADHEIWVDDLQAVLDAVAEVVAAVG
jgi:pimeloyl-ACP methyl ester carboxylesterase